MVIIISLFTDAATEPWLLLSNFAKNRQPVIGTAEIQTQVCLVQGSCCFHFPLLIMPGDKNFECKK